MTDPVFRERAYGLAISHSYCSSVATIVIPAHNESAVIGRLLAQLVPQPPVSGLSIIVVANGCTDNTAEIARSYAPCVQVICIPEASKYLAMLTGDRAATSFPRIYVDADIEIGFRDIQVLAAELRKPGVLAAAPCREIMLDGRPWPVRWYYDIWTRLPEVKNGLFARGALAMSEAGHRRFADLPPLQADDLAAALCFAVTERIISADARVISHPPYKTADLVRRRIRVVTGVAQIERTAAAPPSTARTRPADLLTILRADPASAPKLALFALVTIIARLAARKKLAAGDYVTWLRDESSRSPRAVALSTGADQASRRRLRG